MSSSHPGIVKHHDEMVAAMAKIESSDPSVVIQGMNTLSKKSFEALETNSVHFENYPQLAISLGSLLEVVNPLTSFLFSCGDTGSSSSEYTAGAWPVTLPCQGNPHIKALAFSIDDNTILLSTLNILRNLSFDIVNEPIMGASAPFLQHLVAMLLLSIESGSSFQATHLAIETLINIAGKIDFSGKKRLQGYYFSENTHRVKTSTDALQKNLLQLRVNRHMSSASSLEYAAAATALMSAVTIILSGESFPDRSLTLRTIELLGRLATNSDNAAYLARSPAVLFESLVQLLCASTTFAEPLVSDICHINGDPLGRKRPVAAVCLSNKFATTKTSTASSSTITNNQNASSANLSATTNAVETAPPTQNITFGGIKLDASSAVGGAYASASNLETLNSPPPAPAASSSSQRLAAPANAASNAQASFFTEYSDFEMRDQVLETIHALCLLGPAVQGRLLQVPRLIEILLRIATSASSGMPGGVNGVSGGATSMAGGSGNSMSNTGFTAVTRSEGVIKALQILSLLLALPEAGTSFLSLQSEFVAAACSDDFIAEVVCNKALPVQQDLRARLAYSAQQQAHLDQQFAADASQQQAMQY